MPHKKRENLLCVVDVEKVRVKHSLNDSSNNGNGVEIALGKVAVDPVWNIERPVKSQREEVMRGDGICLAGTLQHEQLRQNRDRLEPDGKCPQNLFCFIFSLETYPLYQSD